MSEKRRKIASFCLKNEAKQSVQAEVFPSALWEDGQEGFYRIRQDGRWKDCEGEFPYRSAEAVSLYIGGLVREALAQSDAAAAEPVKLRKCEPLERCFVPCGPVDAEIGIQLESCEARVMSNNFVIGQDGRQYIAVSAHALGGTVIVAVDDVNFYEETKSPKETGSPR